MPLLQRSAESKARSFSLSVLAVAVIVLGYFAFTALRGLMMLGYVDSAISRVRALSAADAQFSKENPNVGYTCTLSQLPSSQEITRLLAQHGLDNGYAFAIIGCQATVAEKPNATYYVTARPLHSGQPAFCSDQSGILMSDQEGSVEKCLKNRKVFP
jgi:hypothetical protein